MGASRIGTSSDGFVVGLKWSEKKVCRLSVTSVDQRNIPRLESSIAFALGVILLDFLWFLEKLD